MAQQWEPGMRQGKWVVESRDGQAVRVRCECGYARTMSVRHLARSRQCSACARQAARRAGLGFVPPWKRVSGRRVG